MIALLHVKDRRDFEQGLQRCIPDWKPATSFRVAQVFAWIATIAVVALGVLVMRREWGGF